MMQNWLDSQALDVILLQETHWGYTSEWLQEKYYAIHSGTQTRQAGILCLISRKVCSQTDISWQEVEPGRILHVRIHGMNRCVDVVNLYQHVYNTGNLDKRSALWSQLSHLISTFSKKNALVLAGDANCSTDQRCSAVGFPTFVRHGERSYGSLHPDSYLWTQLLKNHDLIALNTWSPHSEATYEFNHQHSRIDYIICRREHGDTLAKDVQLLHDFSLLPLTGAFHIPLITTLRKDWYPSMGTSSTGWTRQQRLRLHQHCTKQDEVFEHFQRQVNTEVQHLIDHSTPDLDTLHSCLMQFSGQVFNISKPEAIHRQSLGPFRRFQEHTRSLRKLTGQDISALFHAWRYVHLRSQARKEMSYSSRASRKHRLTQVYATAARAEKAKDHFAMFQAIRELAPKQSKQRIMLRDEQGHLLGPQESADWIQTWYQAIYSADQHGNSDDPFAWPFDMHDLSSALKSLPTHKALDPSYAPAPMWRYGADKIAEYLDPVLHDFCNHGSFPRCWGAGTLALLVKPGKRGQHPSELRPIALLEPSSKATMGLVARALHHDMRKALCRLPLFAYMGRRGTEDAIHRVVLHCLAVRDRMTTLGFPVHRMTQGAPMPALEGGLSFCLDLTRAFDTVDRAKLFQGLTRLNVDPNLILILQGVYKQTSYAFEHRGVKKCFSTHRGIRQGCKAAPCLWSAFAAILLLQATEVINWQFVINFVTTYADDFCVHQQFTSVLEFEALIHALGKLLDLIESAGLELNVVKTTATLRMKGTLLNKIQRKHLHRTKHGVFLKIPRHDGTFTHIKLVKSFRYLGVMLSYYNFERETMEMRIKHSAQTAQQLHRWIYSTKNIPVRSKVRIWYQCVFSCLRYGILFTGFNDNIILMFYRFCMRQLRRMFKEPVFITRETHQDFLARHNLQDPLLRLHDICWQTADRFHLRTTQIDSDDILHATPMPQFASLSQVLRKVHDRLNSFQNETEVPTTLQQFECPHCNVVFEHHHALRRHLTVAHGDRSGKLRTLNTQPQLATPTCPRCGMHFSTWHSYEYHLQYVCISPLQEIDQVEHRLRVQELLRFARANQVAELRHKPELLSYFQHHCAICQKFLSTLTGLMRHWATAHPRSFKEHLPALNYFCQHVDAGNPCQLCTVAYTRYHRCVIVRQLAMVLTEKQLVELYCDLSAHPELSCPHCGKAYTTQHGLAQHVRRFHEAEEALSDHTWGNFEARCLLEQAVLTQRCDELLEDPNILHFAATQCFACTQTFKRKQELVRHLRQSHGSEWNTIERMALELISTLTLPKRCYCIPAQHHTKHICLIFLQYSLARLLHDRAQQQHNDDLPPDVTLTTRERVEQLMWFGYGQYIYKLSDLKLALTVTCQLCGEACRNGDALALHLYDRHHGDIADCTAHLQLIQWALFQQFGCACNPTRGYGTPNHVCPALIQVALICAQAHWSLVPPWVFRTNEILSYVGDLLPLAALRRIALNLLTRHFERLWNDPDLVQMLKSYCVFCGEPVPLKAIKAHVRISHRLGELEVQAMIALLSKVFLADHSDDERCDHCGDLLPFSVADLAPQPELHLPHCHMLMQFALFLMIPMLHREQYEPERWPSRQAISDAYQNLDLQRSMYNAHASDNDGRDFDHLVQCGLQMLQDPHIKDILSNQCLICGKRFFMPHKMMQHLQSHNYKQMNTLWCLHRLGLYHQPCNFCGSETHQGSTACVALFNLAVLLTNGRRPRQCEIDLGEPPFGRSTSGVGHLRLQGEWSEQKAKAKRTTEATFIGIVACLKRHAGAPCQDGLTAGSQYDGSASGIGVHHPHGTGPSFSPAAPHENSPKLEGRPQDPALAALHDSQGDGDGLGKTGEALSVTDYRGGLCGMRQIWSDRHQSGNAVSEMGSICPQIDSEQREGSTHWRGEEDHAERGEDLTDRPFGGVALSCHDQIASGRSSGQDNSIFADNWKQDEWRTVEHTAQHLISLHLAACPFYPAATDTAKKQSWKAAPEDAMRDLRDDQVKRLVQVLLNTTGTACYINAFLVALCWCTLLTNGLEPTEWLFGFELMRGLTQWSCVPLNVQLYPPFRWLLTGVWTDDELLAQQDIMEFGTILLSRMRPKFISCRWTTRVQHVTKEVATNLDSENGPQHSPIMLRFPNVSAPACSLSDLIELWHDPLGLCRAIDQARPCLILMLDRHVPGLNQKCQQRVDIAEGIVHFPCLASETDAISFIRFDIAAISFHEGSSPNSGHHRTAVRYQQHWLVYDDNRLPDIIHHLPSHVLQNITLIWLIQCTADAARTMNEKHGVETRTSSSSDQTTTLTGHPDQVPGQQDETEPELGAAIALLTGPTSSAGPSQNAPTMASAGSIDDNTIHVPTNAPDADLTQAYKRARIHEATTPMRSDEPLSCSGDDVPSGLFDPAT